MDPLTHGAASLVLQRAFFPRSSWRCVLLIIAAGLVPDIDSLTTALTPLQYLRWHRTATHSLFFAAVLFFAAFLLSRSQRVATNERWRGFSSAAIALAALLHILLDAFQADPIAPLWPVAQLRVEVDLLPYLEPWLLSILLAAIVLPELLLLVSEEIGSRTTRPRGRHGAIAGLAFALLYVGLRFALHSNAVTSLDAHTIAGEMPRRSAAFPDSTSPFLWHGIVETQSTVNLLALRSAGGDVSNASGVTTIHKPEPSPMLTAAQGTSAATAFMQFARFPKATVEKQSKGYSVEIQDLKDLATENKSRAIVADINLDKNANLISSELQWQNSYRPAK